MIPANPVTHILMTNTHINLTGVRAAIKRAFNGSVSEILAELLQNSQRAQATTVNINTTDKTVFAYEDDGHGLQDQDDLIALIKIGESGWDETVQTNQHPMGLGLHALLAQEQVSEVTIESGGWKVVIDTKRWWDDHEYAAGWLERVATSKPQKGFRLIATVTTKFNEIVQELFWHYNGRLKGLNLATGYADYVDVLHNGKKVNPPFDPKNSFETFLCETEIFGNPCWIGHGEKSERPTGVNWYGQRISYQPALDGKKLHSFHLWYDVRQGCPLDTKSPTRNGFIENQKLADFNAAVTRALEDFFDRQSLTDLPVGPFDKFLSTNEGYRQRAAYFTATEVLPLDESMSNADEVGSNGKLCAYAYSDPPRLVKTEIVALGPGETKRYSQQGIRGFQPLVGACYTVTQADVSRLEIQQLWWKPGAAHEKFGNIVEPGEWGVSSDEALPTEWQPVSGEVFVLHEANNWHLQDTDFMFTGLTPEEFLQSGWPWLAFDPTPDDFSYDEIENSFRDSISDALRTLIGNAVPGDFRWSDVRYAIGHENTIISIKPIFSTGGFLCKALQVKYVDKENCEHEIELKTID